MGLRELFYFALQYVKLGVIAGILFFIGAVLYKRRQKRAGKDVPKIKIFLGTLFVMYIAVLFCATLAREGYGRVIKLQPFSSYIAAWNSASASEWRNLIVNILLFIPLGFLLPLLSNRFHKWCHTYAAGFLMAVFIESVQFVFQRGIVEFDDVLNNTLGVMIGYGFSRVVMQFGKYRNKENGTGWGTVLLYQVPAVIVVCAYLGVFYYYSQLPMGTLSCQYSEKVSMSQIEVTSRCELDPHEKEDYVYVSKIWSVEDCQSFAKEFFEKIGAGLSERQNAYENIVILNSEPSQYILQMAYRGGGYELTDFGLEDEIEEMVVDEKINGLSQEKVRELLRPYCVEIPPSSVFSELGDGEYRFEVEPVREGEGWLCGECTVVPTVKDRIWNIRNHILGFSERNGVTICSEREAFECLERGEFVVPEGEMQDLSEISEITVSHVKIAYEIDSKGLGQPVYVFRVVINQNEGETAEIKIPAIR